VKLGVKEIFLGVYNKQEKLKEYAQQQQLSLDEMLYMGDDIPDYVAMQLTALPCCPAMQYPK